MSKTRQSPRAPEQQKKAVVFENRKFNPTLPIRQIVQKVSIQLRIIQYHTVVYLTISRLQGSLHEYLRIKVVG